MSKRHRKQNIASLHEQAQARVFLRLIHASTKDNLLILAVVAWMRVVGKSWSPRLMAQKLLHATVYRPLDPILGRKRGLDLGKLNAERKAEAQLYQLAVSALRHGHAPDFLVALALTDFSSNHYGATTNAADPTENKLLSVYASFTGLALAPQPPAKPPKPPYQPKIPRVLQPPSFAHSYLDGFAAQRFYDARHFGPSETVDTDR